MLITYILIHTSIHIFLCISSVRSCGEFKNKKSPNSPFSFPSHPDSYNEEQRKASAEEWITSLLFKDQSLGKALSLVWLIEDQV